MLSGRILMLTGIKLDYGRTGFADLKGVLQVSLAALARGKGQAVSLHRKQAVVCEHHGHVILAPSRESQIDQVLAVLVGLPTE